MKDITDIDHTGLATLEIFNEAKKFNAWMYSKIANYVGNSVLEIGSGIGNITELISADLVYATDFSKHYVSILKEKFSNNLNISPRYFDITKINSANFEQNIDTIICLNVLEHIEDDDSALNNINTILDMNGFLLLLVPFSNSLYCETDRLLGHYRRYSIETLSSVVQRNGFSVIKIFHFNLFGGIGWYINGKIFNQSKLSGSSINLFEKLVPIFKVIESVRMPFGASLICIAKKNQQTD